MLVSSPNAAATPSAFRVWPGDHRNHRGSVTERKVRATSAGASAAATRSQADSARRATMPSPLRAKAPAGRGGLPESGAGTTSAAGIREIHPSHRAARPAGSRPAHAVGSAGRHVQAQPPAPTSAVSLRRCCSRTCTCSAGARRWWRVAAVGAWHLPRARQTEGSGRCPSRARGRSARRRCA